MVGRITKIDGWIDVYKYKFMKNKMVGSIEKNYENIDGWLDGGYKKYMKKQLDGWMDRDKI